MNPLNASHRQRLSRAIDYSYRELSKYNRLRSHTIKAYLGLSKMSPTGLDRGYEKSLPKGNLLQRAGLHHQIALAYGEPEFIVKARLPEQTGIADRLDAGLNRLAKLLNLGDTARAVAADSFFGFGIFKVGIGELPPALRNATGLQIGPCVWRVSQEDYIYDVTAARRDAMAYEGDIYAMSLEEAVALYPTSADRLRGLVSQFRPQTHHVLARPDRFYSAEEMVWLVDIYFPKSKLIATWPVLNESFGELANEPLAVREHIGHWSGIYEVLTHLYSPDEMIPVAQAESIKALHIFFNEILCLTSEQALLAKINPIYQAGSDQDILRLWQAADRRPVSVSDPSRFGLFEVPGPTQSQTAYMSALLQLFEKFASLDDPARAPSATQGMLKYQASNAIIAEARRRFSRSLQMVGYKLAQLLVDNDQIVLPAAKPLMPGSDIAVPVSWEPLPGTGIRIDEYDIQIDPYSTAYRAPEEKLQTLITAAQFVMSAAQLRAAGAPISVENVLSTFSRYAGLPELKDWFEDVDPSFAASKTAGRKTFAPIGARHYVRHNVSEKTTDGALTQNLSQLVGEQSGAIRVS